MTLTVACRPEEPQSPDTSQEETMKRHLTVGVGDWPPNHTAQCGVGVMPGTLSANLEMMAET